MTTDDEPTPRFEEGDRVVIDLEGTHGELIGRVEQVGERYALVTVEPFVFGYECLSRLYQPHKPE